jgi:gliding motility-associated-like protein
MKCSRILIFSLIFIGFSSNCFSQYITVSENLTINQLVIDKLINNPCAEISNVSVRGIGGGGNESYGYFTAGTSNFPFADGIVLCTGTAISAIGPNTSILSPQNSGAISWSGDEDSRLALGVSSSLDATVLEFDFKPISNTISFEYIFSSEQYLSNPSPNQCGFTDGFVFLLREANTSNPYQNLAIVPGTTLPVTVNNVRGQGTICPPANEQYFDAFNGTQHPTNFNGQTKTLIATSNVTAGTLYHIKIVVADQGNNLFDSAIFLKGGSFNIGTNLGIDKLIANQNPLCAGEISILNASQPNAQSYKWFKNGNLILDMISALPIATPTYEVTDSGVYKVAVEISASCILTDEIVIEYVPPPTVVDTILLQCDDNSDGITTYDLTKVKNIVTGNDPQLTVVNYYTSLFEAQNNTNQIVYPREFTNTTANQIIYVRIKNQFNCVAIAKITLQITTTSVNSIVADFCDRSGIQDGITELSQIDFGTVTSQLLTGLPTGLQVTYHTTYDKALLQIDAISLSFLNTTPFQQVVYAAVVNGSDCYGIVPVTLNINTFLPTGFETEIVSICSGVAETISAPAGYSNYVWTPTNTSNSNQISVITSGIYSVEVTNNKGCKATKEFQVESSEAAIIQNIVINDFNGNSNTVLINYSGNGDYEFSLDGINFQNIPYFTDVPSAEYTIIVNDKKGCGITPAEIYVLAYPTFFTPNGDGYNDVWKIKNISTKPNSRIELFDRYGKLIGNFDTETGWNGKLNQQQLPADDYWFLLKLENGKQIKGHFALKR